MGALREFTVMPSRDMGNKEGSAQKGKIQYFNLLNILTQPRALHAVRQALEIP
jgi:hypothetical protein